MLKAQEIACFKRDGYLPKVPLLTGEYTDELRGQCERSCVEVIREGERRQSTNRLKPYLLFPWAADLVRYAPLLDVIEDLIGPDILVFHTTVWLKEANSESFVPWHQDATYFGLAPFEQVTAWIALTPSTRENGCVQILPASHREGQRPHRDQVDERALLSRGQTLSETLEEANAVDLTLEPGEVSFHHTLAKHRSAPNHSTKRRIGIGVSYIPAHVRHIGPTRLSATLVRGTNTGNHFDLERAPDGTDGTAAAAVHLDSLERFWRASEGIPEMAFAH
jgi:hypothetical protein